MSTNLNIHEGTNYNIEFHITDINGAYFDLTDSEISWSMARGSLSNSGVINKVLNSGIEIIAALSGMCQVSLTPVDSSGLYGQYYHELGVVDSDGNTCVVDYGYINILPRLGY